MTYQTPLMVENMIQGWTRIEMLIALYERAIDAVDAAQQTAENNQPIESARYQLEANRMILGLFAGLDTDHCEIAKNVARILTFVALQVEQGAFPNALVHLRRLHKSFVAIKPDAIELEKQGQIPPIESVKLLDTVA